MIITHTFHIAKETSLVIRKKKINIDQLRAMVIDWVKKYKEREVSFKPFFCFSANKRLAKTLNLVFPLTDEYINLAKEIIDIAEECETTVTNLIRFIIIGNLTPELFEDRI